MAWKKTVFRESLWFVLAAAGSFLFWGISACLADQCIITKESIYQKEFSAFLVTIGFVYFMRLNTWAIRHRMHKSKKVGLDTVYFGEQMPDEPISQTRRPDNESVAVSSPKDRDTPGN